MDNVLHNVLHTQHPLCITQRYIKPIIVFIKIFYIFCLFILPPSTTVPSALLIRMPTYHALKSNPAVCLVLWQKLQTLMKASISIFMA